MSIPPSITPAQASGQSRNFSDASTPAPALNRSAGASPADLGYPIISVPYFDCAEPMEGSEYEVAATLEELSKSMRGTSGLRHTSDSSNPARSHSERSNQPSDSPSKQGANNSTDDSEDGSRTSSLEAALSGLVDSILDRFPLSDPALIMFAGSERNPHTDETCTQVAYSLAHRHVGNILLIDSNPTHRLSRISHMEDAAGISNVVDGEPDWRSLVVKESSPGLDFLSIGTKRFDGWGGAKRLREAIAQMKKEYQFICVTTGDAHTEVAKLWSGACDGSYLLVSLKNSNRSIAQSAVTELQTSGARLLGCVVTDAS